LGTFSRGVDFARKEIVSNIVMVRKMKTTRRFGRSTMPVRRKEGWRGLMGREREDASSFELRRDQRKEDIGGRI